MGLRHVLVDHGQITGEDSLWSMDSFYNERVSRGGSGVYCRASNIQGISQGLERESSARIRSCDLPLYFRIAISND